MKLIRFSLVFTLLCLAGFGATGWYISAHLSPENITAGGKKYSIARGNGSEYGFFYVFTGKNDTVLLRLHRPAAWYKKTTEGTEEGHREHEAKLLCAPQWFSFPANRNRQPPLSL